MAAGDGYRKFAADCVRVAREARDDNDRALLLEMAETWRRLAAQADSASKTELG